MAGTSRTSCPCTQREGSGNNTGKSSRCVLVSGSIDKIQVDREIVCGKWNLVLYSNIRG
jgi:hypothetical protein